MKRRSTFVVAGIAAVLLLATTQTGIVAAGDDGWTVKKALKRIDEATKGFRGVIAEVEWKELLGPDDSVGSGKIWVNFDRRARAEIGGDNPRTVLVVSPDMYVYRPNQKTVEAHYMTANPDLLPQYVLLGFFPTGTELKEKYKVKLVRQETIDGHDTVALSLEPKSKEVKASISGIVVWFDLGTWMPVQQVIRHQLGLQGTVRYQSMTLEDDLPNELFHADWPPDTTVIKK